MKPPSDIRELPDISAEQRVVHKLILRILQLHWMGMDDEAEQTQLALHQLAGRVLLADRSSGGGPPNIKCLNHLRPLLSQSLPAGRPQVEMPDHAFQPPSG